MKKQRKAKKEVTVSTTRTGIASFIYHLEYSTGKVEDCDYNVVQWAVHATALTACGWAIKYV